MIQAIDITQNDKGKKLIENINFTLPNKGCFLFHSDDNSCKHLFEILSLSKKATSGKYLFQNEDLLSSSAKAEDFRKYDIGIVSQFDEIDDSTTHDDLETYALLYQFDKEKVIKDFTTSPYFIKTDQKLSNLNKEEQAMLLLFKAVYKNPNIIMVSYDEFTWSETLLKMIQEESHYRLVLLFSTQIPNLSFDGTIEISDHTIKKNICFTDEDNSQKEKKESKTSLKNTFLLSKKIYPKKRKNSLSTIIVSSIGLFFVLLTSLMHHYSRESLTAYSLSHSEREVFGINKRVEAMDSYKSTYFSPSVSRYPFSADEIDHLIEETGLEIYGSMDFDSTNNILSEKNTYFSKVLMSTTKRFQSASYIETLLSGNLPTAENEIAIGENVFRLYQENGFIDTKTNEILLPNTIKEDSLNGHFVDLGLGIDFKITGIVKGNIDYSKYSSLKTPLVDNTSLPKLYYSLYEKTRNDYYANGFFYTDSFYQNYRNANLSFSLDNPISLPNSNKTEIDRIRNENSIDSSLYVSINKEGLILNREIINNLLFEEYGAISLSRKIPLDETTQSIVKKSKYNDKLKSEINVYYFSFSKENLKKALQMTAYYLSCYDNYESILSSKPSWIDELSEKDQTALNNASDRDAFSYNLALILSENELWYSSLSSIKKNAEEKRNKMVESYLPSCYETLIEMSPELVSNYDLKNRKISIANKEVALKGIDLKDLDASLAMSKDMMNDFSYQPTFFTATLKNPKSKSKLRRISSLHCEYPVSNRGTHLLNDSFVKKGTYYVLYSDEITQLESIDNVFHLLGNFTFIFALISLVFSIFMIWDFCSTNIKKNKNKIRSLRNMGARKKEVSFSLFFSFLPLLGWTILFTMISFILFSFLLSLILSLAGGTPIMFSPFSWILLIIILCFLLLFIFLSFLSIHSMMKKEEKEESH